MFSDHKAIKLVANSKKVVQNNTTCFKILKTFLINFNTTWIIYYVVVYVVYVQYVTCQKHLYALGIYCYHLICDYIQYAFSFVLHLFRSRFMHFNKILQFYSYRSHAGFMLLMLSSAEQSLFSWATLSMEFHTMFHQFTIISICLPSLISTWLKTVIPSVLAGRWHVSLIFLTQISVHIQIAYSFSDSGKGLLKEHLLDTKNDHCAFLLLVLVSQKNIFLL